MAEALRRTVESIGVDDARQINRIGRAHAVAVWGDIRAGDSPDDVMSDPLHPMHRQLMARISRQNANEASPVSRGLTTPQRLAIIFYAAIAAWGLVLSATAAVIASI